MSWIGASVLTVMLPTRLGDANAIADRVVRERELRPDDGSG